MESWNQLRWGPTSRFGMHGAAMALLMDTVSDEVRNATHTLGSVSMANANEPDRDSIVVGQWHLDQAHKMLVHVKYSIGLLIEDVRGSTAYVENLPMVDRDEIFAFLTQHSDINATKWQRMRELLDTGGLIEVLRKLDAELNVPINFVKSALHALKRIHGGDDDVYAKTAFWRAFSQFLATLDDFRDSFLAAGVLWSTLWHRRRTLSGPAQHQRVH